MFVRLFYVLWPSNHFLLTQKFSNVYEALIPIPGLRLLKPDGTVLADSEENPVTMDNHANRPEIRAARSQGHGTTIRFSDTTDKEMMYYTLSR